MHGLGVLWFRVSGLVGLVFALCSVAIVRMTIYHARALAGSQQIMKATHTCRSLHLSPRYQNSPAPVDLSPVPA